MKTKGANYPAIRDDEQAKINSSIKSCRHQSGKEAAEQSMKQRETSGNTREQERFSW